MMATGEGKGRTRQMTTAIQSQPKYVIVPNDYGRTWHKPDCPALRTAKVKRGTNLEPAEYKAALEAKRGYTDYSTNKLCGRCLAPAPATSPTFTASEARALFAKAHAAGTAAGNGHKPTPMVVYTPKDQLGSMLGHNDVSFADDGKGGLMVRGNNIDDREPVYTVPDGVCGFAWVNIRPGNCSLARHAHKLLKARTGYYGGMEIWVNGFGQSYERKRAYASAYAEVMRAAGVDAYPGSRLD